MKKRLLTTLMAMATMASVAADDALWQRFASPSDEARTKVWWFHGETETTEEGIDADLEAFKEKSSPTLADVRERHGLELNMILNITRSIPKLFPEFVEKRFSTDIDVDGIVAALNDFMENEHLY